MLILDRDVCKTCGNPVWLCHTASSEVEFEIRSSWCYGKAELAEYEDAQNTPKLEEGEYRFAVAVGASNGPGEPRDPLPSRAEALKNTAIVVRTGESE